MGVHQLSRVIADNAPKGILKNDIKNYFGRKVAIDASMSIYQFLIAVRSEGQNLATQDGETTSHLMGMFYRTIRMVENGIQPCYVFDGQPPDLKKRELEKRLARREEAEKAKERAKEEGRAEDVEKFERRGVKVTKRHNEEVQKLLSLMGVPVVLAPGEAEAQAAVLCKAGKVYAAGSEDMDTLAYGAPVLLRHLTFSEARKMPITEYRLETILSELGMSMPTFIDMCILLGCDYVDSIRGIGPHRAYNLLKQHKSLCATLKKLDVDKYPRPAYYPIEEVHEQFKNPLVLDPEQVDLTWLKPDEEGLVKYMCGEKGFAEDRIRNGVKKLMKARVGGRQSRLDGFFKRVPKVNPEPGQKTKDLPGSAQKKNVATRKGAPPSSGRAQASAARKRPMSSPTVKKTPASSRTGDSSATSSPDSTVRDENRPKNSLPQPSDAADENSTPSDKESEPQIDEPAAKIPKAREGTDVGTERGSDQSGEGDSDDKTTARKPGRRLVRRTGST